MKYLIVSIVEFAFIAYALYCFHRCDQQIAEAQKKLDAALSAASATSGGDGNG